MADEPKVMTPEDVERLLEERTAGLKANRDELAREAKAAKAALKAWDGADREEYDRLKKSAAEIERKRATDEGNFKAVEKQLTDLHAAERATDGKKIAKLTAALEKRGIRANLVAALSRAGAKPGMVELLVGEGARFMRMRETEDDFEEFVADEQGHPRMADSTGRPLSVEAFVEQALKAKYPDAFNGTGSSGGGASRSAASGSGGTAFIAANDGKAFLANLEGVAKGTTELR